MNDSKEVAMKIHPAAEIFPMMTKDELNDLAADIKANGLLTPIVVDENGILIDGRNRLAACKIAGVKPEFSKLNGHDPSAFILSSNIARRHMTKGQQAMAVAMIYPETEKRGPKNKGDDSKIESIPIHRGSLSQARAVLANAPELAKIVIEGAKSLTDAHETVRRRLDEASSDEAKLANLREQAPDVAELVIEGKLTLIAAAAEVSERKRVDAEARAHARKSAAI